MPELPEVETVKEGLRPAMEGRLIKQVVLNRSNLRYPFSKNFQESIEGKVIKNLKRRGKYIIVSLDDCYLIIHLGMSGSFRIEGNEYEKQSHDHVVFKTDNHHIIYNDPRRFGFMELVRSLSEYKPFNKMGIEPLDDGFDGLHLYEMLKRKSGPIKNVLLDQSIVAGLGNIYVCEALLLSKISPLAPANKIAVKKLEKLVEAIKLVLDKAIKVGGSSIRDHKQADGTMGYFQHEFIVYNKEGKTCAQCMSNEKVIKRIVQSGRSTFFCPNCQK